jgi:Immunity protein family (Imm11)
LYGPTPVFSHRAWNALQPRVTRSVEALPIFLPSGEPLFAINVLDLVDCLDQATTQLSRSNVTGRVSSVQRYGFKDGACEGKVMFKTPETKGLEVLVTDTFKRAVEANHLRGVIFRKIGET